MKIYERLIYLTGRLIHDLASSNSVWTGVNRVIFFLSGRKERSSSQTIGRFELLSSSVHHFDMQALIVWFNQMNGGKQTLGSNRPCIYMRFSAAIIPHLWTQYVPEVTMTRSIQVRSLPHWPAIFFFIFYFFIREGKQLFRLTSRQQAFQRKKEVVQATTIKCCTSNHETSSSWFTISKGKNIYRASAMSKCQIVDMVVFL